MSEQNIYEQLRDEYDSDSERQMTTAKRLVMNYIRDKYGVSVKPREVILITFNGLLKNWRARLRVTSLDGYIFDVMYDAAKELILVTIYKRDAEFTFPEEFGGISPRFPINTKESNA